MKRADWELEQRRRAIRWSLAGKSYSTICERLGRSRPWLAKWIRRFKAHRWDGLMNASRRPTHIPRSTPAHIVNRILALRTELEEHRTARTRFRGVGAIEIWELLRAERRRRLPAVRTIERVLQAHGCRRPASKRSGGGRPYPYLRTERPGDLHQTDLVGPRYVRGVKGSTRFYSLHTVASVGRGVWASQHRFKSSDAFCRHFLGAWQWLGVPRISQMDNEMAATGGGRHRFGLSAVVRLHLLVGSHLVFVPPGEPGRNPLVESFNNMWQQRVLSHRHADLRSVRRISRSYLRFYHERKPNRALAVATDGTRFPGLWLRRYRAALRWLPRGGCLEQYRDRRGRLPVAAGQVSWIQRVDDNGNISVNARPYFVGKRRTGEYVQATLWTHRQELVIYTAQHRVLKRFPFKIRGKIGRPIPCNGACGN